MNKETVYMNKISEDHIVQNRLSIPEDYHCHCEFCENFLGEIFHKDSNRYYSNLIRKEYYPKLEEIHLDVGQSIGYRWAVQKFTKPGDWIFDPTVGSGTAIVESIIQGRNAAGIELEFPRIAEKNIAEQYTKGRVAEGIIGKLFPGNALKMDTIIGGEFPESHFDLIINGTPYPTSGKGRSSSDAPERKKNFGKEQVDKTFTYQHPENIGSTHGGGEYNKFVGELYSKSIKYLKPNGYLIILIKDVCRKKSIYNLHKHISDIILEECPSLSKHGFFIHRHAPETLFLRTYKKITGITPPLYQTGVVFKNDN